MRVPRERGICYIFWSGKRMNPKLFSCKTVYFWPSISTYFFKKNCIKRETAAAKSVSIVWSFFYSPNIPAATDKLPFYKKTSNNHYTAHKRGKKRRGKTTKTSLFLSCPIVRPPFPPLSSPHIFPQENCSGKNFFLSTIPFVPNSRSLSSPPVHDLFNYQLVTWVIFRTPPPLPLPCQNFFEGGPRPRFPLPFFPGKRLWIRSS